MMPYGGLRIFSVNSGGIARESWVCRTAEMGKWLWKRASPKLSLLAERALSFEERAERALAENARVCSARARALGAVFLLWRMHRDMEAFKRSYGIEKEWETCLPPKPPASAEASGRGAVAAFDAERNSLK
ncbi:MAG: hypothetical protein QXH30_03720 [Candidatus Bilamarchaeaceae archaeon]